MSKQVVLTRKAAAAQGALLVFLKPKLAKDTKMPEIRMALDRALAPVTAKNYRSRKQSVVAAVKKITEGKLAKDASMEDLVKLLDAVDDVDPLEAGTVDALETDPSTGLPMAAAKKEKHEGEVEDADPMSNLKGYLKGKGMSEDDIEGACNAVGKPSPGDADMDEEDEEDEAEDDNGKMAGEAGKGGLAGDEPPDFKGKPKIGGGMVTKDEMSKAVKAAQQHAQDSITAAVRAERQSAADTREAERFVRPWIGDLAMAHDSAEAVYRTALTALGKDVTGIHPTALRAVLEAQPQSNSRPQQRVIASDSADAVADFAKRFPGAARIKVL